MKNKFMIDLNAFLNDYLPNVLGSSPNTIKSYKHSFRLFLQFISDNYKLSPDKIKYDVVTIDLIAEFLNWLEDNRQCSVNTRNQRLAALTSFGNYTQLRSSDGLGFSSIVHQIPRKKGLVRNITFFTMDELKILLKLPNSNSNIGARDKTILSFMYATGARAQEVCDVKVGDISYKNTGEGVVALTGKGNKTRRVIIPIQCVKLIKAYLKRFKLDQSKEKYLFFSQTHDHMTISCVEEIFKKYIAKAKKLYPKLFNNSYSPHSMRHTTATHMLQAGVPLIVIKNFLGHVSVNTTQIYAEVTQQTVNEYVIKWNEQFHEDGKIKQPDKKLPDFLY